MKRISTLLFSLTLILSSATGQQTERVNIGDATSAITSTANSLNRFYHDIIKAGDIDPAIKDRISSISNMVFLCREAIVNISYNASSIGEEKKAKVVAASKVIEADADAIDPNDSKNNILIQLKAIEKKVKDLSKSLGIKLKKKK